MFDLQLATFHYVAHSFINKPAADMSKLCIAMAMLTISILYTIYT